MKIALIVSVFALLLGIAPAQADQPRSLYDISATMIDGQSRALSEYKGKVALVVNVASFCGYTPQYEGLERIYSRFGARGFVVLAFPSNDFGGQEPGSDAEIKRFCSDRYNVSFPLFSKVRVLGPEKHPLYRFLVASTGGAEVGWNFEKFLIGRNGLVLERFKSGVSPDASELVGAIEKELGAG